LTAAPQVAGPAGRALTGNLRAFANDPLDFLSRTAREFGPVSALRFGRSRAYLISDPAMIEEVLVKKRLDFIKAGPIRAQRRLFGRGLLINEGNSWAHQRRLAQPAFHPGRLGPYVAPIARHTEAMLERWKSLERIDVHDEVQKLLMVIVAESLFGPDVGPEATRIGAAVEAAMDRYAARRGAARLLPDWVPLEDSKRYVEGVSALDSFVRNTVDRRRDSSPREDLLQTLLDARDESGRGMSDQQIRDEAVNLFVGGFDTPSLALAWTWYLLAKNPHCAAQVAQEAVAVLGNKGAPSLSDLQRLNYTQKVLKESMRLYPPAWLLGREAVTDTRIGGAKIRKGETILISQWVMHRSKEYFEHADEFRPERWDVDLALPRFVYFPFGAGPRVCIGAAFATLECTFVIAMIARRFRFAMSTGSPVEPRATMTLRPRGGIPAPVIAR
jgi:cytochrome P450